MKYRQATLNDSSLLAKLNHQLIRDEGHRNPMTVPELENRMRGWLSTDYEAIIFEDGSDVKTEQRIDEINGLTISCWMQQSNPFLSIIRC
jgi:hypothetical protein